MRQLNDKIPGAPNFRYKEFVRSDTAIRFGIKNIPDEEQWQCIEKTAVNILQPVRNRFGSIRILSGFRCLELNRKIGSTDSSNHPKGQAADIEPIDPNVSLLDIIIFIYDELEFRTCIAEFFPNGWVHCDYREDGNDHRLKLKDPNHNYENVDIEYLMELYNHKTGEVNGFEDISFKGI